MITAVKVFGSDTMYCHVPVVFSKAAVMVGSLGPEEGKR